MNRDTLSEAKSAQARSFGNALLAGVLSALAASALYLLTLSAGLGWHDSAELSLRAAVLGGTHSPGSPLHTLAGWLFGQFLPSPTLATNVLSALSMGAAAGVLAALTWLITGRLFLLAALLFACGFQVWSNAVVTELYGLSTLFGLLSFVCLYQWHIQNRTGWLVAGLISCGLALATWFPGILLAPAFIGLLLSKRSSAARNLLIAVVVIVTALVMIVLANYWLTLRLPPHGPDLPLNVQGTWRYLTGAMHEPLAVRDTAFFTSRLSEHFLIFARSFIWIGMPVGLLGAYALIARDKVFGIFMLAIVAIQITYFTFFGAGDYYSMVVLSYAVFSLWIVTGTLWLIERIPAARIWLLAGLACIPAIQVWQQLPQRLAARLNSPAQAFVDNSFQAVPSGALLIAGWQQFTALEYGQKIQGQRPDLRIILPATTTRHYGEETVASYLDVIKADYCSRPVFTHKVKPELEERFLLEPVNSPEGWFRIIDQRADCSAVR